MVSGPGDDGGCLYRLGACGFPGHREQLVEAEVGPAVAELVEDIAEVGPGVGDIGDLAAAKECVENRESLGRFVAAGEEPVFAAEGNDGFILRHSFALFSSSDGRAVSDVGWVFFEQLCCVVQLVLQGAVSRKRGFATGHLGAAGEREAACHR